MTDALTEAAAKRLSDATPIAHLRGAVARLWPRVKLTDGQAEALLRKFRGISVTRIAEALAEQFNDNPDATKPSWVDCYWRCRRAAKRAAGKWTRRDDEFDGQRAALARWAAESHELAAVCEDVLRADSDGELSGRDVDGWYAAIHDYGVFMHSFGRAGQTVDCDAMQRACQRLLVQLEALPPCGPSAGGWREAAMRVLRDEHGKGAA